VDDLDKALINRLQDGFPISDNPYADIAAELGSDESTVIQRLQDMLDQKVLTRFGPMYHAEKLGGAFSLVAMKLPEHDFQRVSEIVNSFSEVAHNYQRDHAFNMWFVLATETPEQINEINAEISMQTGYPVYNMPKLEEFYVKLKFTV